MNAMCLRNYNCIIGSIVNTVKFISANVIRNGKPVYRKAASDNTNVSVTQVASKMYILTCKPMENTFATQQLFQSW